MITPLIVADSTRFLLHTANGSYGFGLHRDGYLTHLHWGARLTRLDDLPSPIEVLCYRNRSPKTGGDSSRQEYPGWGGEFYTEPALKIDFPNGDGAVMLKYCSHEITATDDDAQLTVVTQDEIARVQVTLHYRVRRDCAVLERWSDIVNLGSERIVLRSALSAAWHLPRAHAPYRLSHLMGRWGSESQRQRQILTPGKMVLESRTGLSGPFATPLVMLDAGDATEHAGRVWFLTVHWSGNWKIAVEQDGYEQVNLLGGINDFDFSWPLPPGETFTTPLCSGGLSEEGWGGASRALHRYQTESILPRETMREPFPLLFNSWASLSVNVSEATLMPVAEKAAAVGAELFVIDDGWQSALGDWEPDAVKFPHGLEPLIAQVRALGMDFGLWIEMESFELRSQLYQEHPDWAMSFPGREPHRRYRADVDRTSCLLNFAREDVAAHMLATMLRLVRQTGIRYLKLDMNYFFADPGWAAVPADERQTLWVRYTRNVQHVLRELHREFPQLLIENCASGAGRADLGLSPYCSRINRSDNQDTLDVLKLHEGFTWLHPSRLAGGGCHISDSMDHVNRRHTPMRFQAYAGLMGSLSIGKNLPACTPAELNEIRSYGDLYKRFRPITQLGTLYRIASHFYHPYAAFEFVSPDRSEALLFAFGHALQFNYKVPEFRLHGLDPGALYAIEPIGMPLHKECYSAAVDYTRPRCGRALMEPGIRIDLAGDYDAQLLHFRKLENVS